MAKTHKTAGGKEIDLQSLILKNETVRAVGNMNVNARGDVLDNTNKATSTRSAQVNKSYRKQIGNVAKDLPVVASKKDMPVAEEVVGLDDASSIELVEAKPVEAKAPAGGLAEAMTKARESKSIKKSKQE